MHDYALRCTHSRTVSSTTPRLELYVARLEVILLNLKDSKFN